MLLLTSSAWEGPASDFSRFVGQCSRVGLALGELPHLVAALLQKKNGTSKVGCLDISHYLFAEVEFLQDAQHMPPMKVGP